MTIEQLYKLHYRELVYYGGKFINDKSIVHDIVIDVFIRSEKLKEQARKFLYLCVKNKCLDHLKKERPSIIQDYELNDLADLEAAQIEADVIKRIYEGIDNLPPKEKKIVDLIILGKKSIEIALILGKDAATVRSLKRHAIERLSKLINYGNDEYS